MFFEQTRIFQEVLSNRPYYLIEQILIFPETLILVLEHIRDLLTKYLFERGHLPGKLYVVEN